MPYCFRCGKRMQAHHRICPYCGAYAHRHHGKSNMMGIIVRLIIIVALVIAFIVILNSK